MKKCFGVSLVFFIIFGLSLNASLNTSALQHDVKTIPIASEYYRGGSFNNNLISNPLYENQYLGGQNPGFRISWQTPNIPKYSDLNLDYARYFNSRLNNTLCSLDSYRTMPQWENGQDFTFSFRSARWNNNQDSFSFCNQTSPFGELLSSQTNIISHPPFDNISFQQIPILNRSKYQSLLPYYYSYDSIYINDSKTSSSTGVTYHNSLDMKEFVGIVPNKFYQMDISIPLPDESSTGTLYQGRHLEYKSLFYFKSKNDFYLNFEGSNSFRFFYTLKSDTSGDFYSEGFACPFTTSKIQDINGDWSIQVEVSCQLDLPATVYNGQFWTYLQLRSDGSNYVFDTNAETWNFSSAYFITDNDNTPGGTWGFAPTGNELDSAPGSASSLLPSENWFDNLTNLFNFSVLNPFAPLFELFTNSDECVQIPILAGMLHSEETTYCPWFSGQTRAILTPVLGLASAMLLFGFFVRWLGSTSDGLLEDGKNEVLSSHNGWHRRSNK